MSCIAVVLYQVTNSLQQVIQVIHSHTLWPTHALHSCQSHDNRDVVGGQYGQWYCDSETNSVGKRIAPTRIVCHRVRNTLTTINGAFNDHPYLYIGKCVVKSSDNYIPRVCRLAINFCKCLWLVGRLSQSRLTKTRLPIMMLVTRSVCLKCCCYPLGILLTYVSVGHTNSYLVYWGLMSFIESRTLIVSFLTLL